MDPSAEHRPGGRLRSTGLLQELLLNEVIQVTEWLVAAGKTGGTESGESAWPTEEAGGTG